jgi:hypothetical protein
MVGTEPMRLKLELDRETSDALNRAAERELRLPSQQAEALLRKALGLPLPLLDEDEPPDARQKAAIEAAPVP